MTGGSDGLGYRDEVLCGILCVISFFCLQVLQFNVEARTWTEIGRLESGRNNHAIAEVNLRSIGCVGNLNPVKKEEKVIIILSPIAVKY